jgi:hypothetical protein
LSTNIRFQLFQLFIHYSIVPGYGQLLLKTSPDSQPSNPTAKAPHHHIRSLTPYCTTLVRSRTGACPLRSPGRRAPDSSRASSVWRKVSEVSANFG